MGNNNVYGEGRYITPNKIQRPFKLQQQYLNIENVFGKVDIPSARAVKADDTLNEQIQIEPVTSIKYYEKVQEQQAGHKPELSSHNKQNIDLNEEAANSQNMISIKQRKVKTVFSHSLVRNTSNYAIDKYKTNKDSPIRNQNANSEGSQVQILCSRVRVQYFRRYSYGLVQNDLSYNNPGGMQYHLQNHPKLAQYHSYHPRNYNKQQHNNQYWLGKRNKISPNIQNQKNIESKLQAEISCLKTNIAEQKQHIVQKHKNSQQTHWEEVEPIMDKFCNKMYEVTNVMSFKKSILSQLQRNVCKKTKQLGLLEQSRLQYRESNVLLDDYDDNIRVLGGLHQQMQYLENVILANLSPTQELLEQIQTARQLLANKSRQCSRAQQQSEMKQLEQQIEKNKLVVELGRYEQISRQQQQKQQILKSLERHSEQIQARIQTLTRQQSQLQKTHTSMSSNCGLHKSIHDQEQQKQQLLLQNTHLLNIIAQLQDHKSSGFNEGECQVKIWEDEQVRAKQEQIRVLEGKLEGVIEQYQQLKKMERKKISKKEKKYEALRIINQDLYTSVQFLHQQISKCKETLQQYQQQLKQQQQSETQEMHPLQKQQQPHPHHKPIQQPSRQPSKQWKENKSPQAMYKSRRIESTSGQSLENKLILLIVVFVAAALLPAFLF